MADLIKDNDQQKFVGFAKELIEKGCLSPIQIIQQIRRETGCSIGEAKESYVLAANNETLGEYQERVILPLLEGLEDLDQ